MPVYRKIDHGRPRQSQVQPGTARYSAEKTHHVLYFRKAGALRISNMRGRPLENHLGITWRPLREHLGSTRHLRTSSKACLGIIGPVPPSGSAPIPLHYTCLHLVWSACVISTSLRTALKVARGVQILGKSVKFVS